MFSSRQSGKVNNNVQIGSVGNNSPITVMAQGVSAPLVLHEVLRAQCSPQEIKKAAQRSLLAIGLAALGTASDIFGVLLISGVIFWWASLSDW